ncbi:MAG: xcpT 16 [Planctomycetaceae bacterium]|nr:xcpT 16 [Planctomycetaceae bacterium]
MRRNSANDFSRQQYGPARQAFTLIELMIVIVVIATLLALLLPAVSSVFGVARESQVQIEMRSVEQGIAAFKAQMGLEPPSRITLAEIASQTPARDQAILRRIWPRLNFAGNTYDWNGNGTAGEMNTTVTLRGAECLVFFLGGVRAYDTSTSTLLNSMSGFSRNPANPFTVQGAGELRDGPFFEFKTSRLVTSNIYPNFLVYIDPLPGHAPPYAPYVYASSYEGRGYEAIDLVNNPSPASVPPNTQLSSAYFLSTTSFINPKTFQIISPGPDHLYGDGGQYLESAMSNNCNLSNKADYDNLTNFHGGRLKP